MPASTRLSAADFDRLRKLDTCTVSNAIERLGVRLRDEGFASSAVRCQFPQLGPMLGYAVTARARSSQPPIKIRWYHERMDWWNYIAGMPEPRVMVVQDIDETPGFGALVGAVHSAIALALNCAGHVTNGAVRDLSKVESMGFHLFAGGVAVSHAYAHIVDFGGPVEIAGLKISPGDLIQGDRHGIQTIPLPIAPQIPDLAQAVLDQEREILDFCASPQFSLQGLSEILERLSNGSAAHG